MEEISIKIAQKLVMIVWEDSQLGYQGWKVVQEQPKGFPYYVSVGFLVYEDERCKILYPHLKNTSEDDDLSGSGDIQIPVSAIIKEVELPISF